MIDRVYQLEDVLRRIKQWCDAYPISIFTPVDDDTLKKVHELLAAEGISMTAMHAQWARHILAGIGDIIGNTLKEASHE